MSAVVLAACGGLSTAGTKGGLQLTPVGDATQVAVGVANAAWLEWKEGTGKFLDRDFFDCYELNGVAKPPFTPVPDPSGHTRARRGCDEALAAIERAVPDYQRLVDNLRAAKLDAGSPFKPQFDAVMAARAERLTWAKASVAAWKTNQIEALENLRKQIPELGKLESVALGIDTTRERTPEPRPTLDYIPGVATPTPPPP